MNREDWMRFRPAGRTCETLYQRSCCYELCQSSREPEKFLKASMALSYSLIIVGLSMLLYIAGGGLGEY